MFYILDKNTSQAKSVRITIALFLAAIMGRGAPSDLSQTILIIQSLLEEGKLPAASLLINSALEQHPNDGGLLNLRGVVHAQEHELQKARKDFASAVRLAPDLIAAWQNLARACQMEAERDSSAATCAVEAWQRVLRWMPNDNEAHRSLALFYEKEGNFSGSLKELEKLPAEDVSKPDLQQLAAAYEQTGRLTEARLTLERVAALEPRNTSHLLELARLADEGKDYEGALGYLAHARDLAPADAQIHYLFAMIATKMELPIEARHSLERALALQPENPAYNYAMGFVILSTRDAATAAQYFKKFVEAKPQEVQGHYALGIACFASGDDAHSKEEMLRAKDNPKTAGGAEYFLGRIARREDHVGEAVLHLQRSIGLLPNFSEPHTELARIWMSEGKLPEAQTELERALHLDSRSFQANEQLLVLYKRTHDQRAVRQAEVVKKLDEDRSRRAELMLRTIEVRP